MLNLGDIPVKGLIVLPEDGCVEGAFVDKRVVKSNADISTVTILPLKLDLLNVKKQAAGLKIQ